MHLYKWADYEDKRVSIRGDHLSSYKNLFPKIQNTIFNKVDMNTNDNITFKPLYNISRRVQQDKALDSCFPYEDQHVKPSSNTSLLFKHYFEDKYSDIVNKQLFLKNQEKSLSLNFMKYRPLKQRLMQVLNKTKSGKKVVSFIDEKPIEKCEEMCHGNTKKRNDLQNLRIQLKNIQNLCYKKRGLEVKPILKFSNRVKSMGKGIKKGLNGREKLIQPTMCSIKKVVINVMQQSANKTFGNPMDEGKLKDLIKEELDALFNEKIENYKNKHALNSEGIMPKSQVKPANNDQTNTSNNEESNSKLAARNFIKSELASIDHIILNLVENRMVINEQLSAKPSSSIQDTILKLSGKGSSIEGKSGKIKRGKMVKKKNLRSPKKIKTAKNTLQKSEAHSWASTKQMKSKQSIFPRTNSSKRSSKDGISVSSKKSSFSLLKEEILNAFITENKEGDNKEKQENVCKEKLAVENIEVQTSLDNSLQCKDSDHMLLSLKQNFFDETDKYAEKERQLLLVTDSLEIIRAKMKKVLDPHFQIIGPKRKATATNFQPGKRTKYQSILKTHPTSPPNKNKKVSFDMNIKKIL